MRTRFTVFALVFCQVLWFAVPGEAETIARCGDGWLERIDGYPVLHVKGTPYEMGYQHGALLQRIGAREFEECTGEQTVGSARFGTNQLQPRWVIDSIVIAQASHVPSWYTEELRRGGRSGAGRAGRGGGEFSAGAVSLQRLCRDELRHADGTLYHGRILDYACDWHLQDHAVLIVAQPAAGIPFVNVSFAGFIGSVTGMNAQHVSIGEMGGKGLGHWDGTPMAVLVAQNTAAVRRFGGRPSTCSARPRERASIFTSSPMAKPTRVRTGGIVG